MKVGALFLCVYTVFKFELCLKWIRLLVFQSGVDSCN